MLCNKIIAVNNRQTAQAHLPARQAFLGTMIWAQGSFCSDISGFITIDDKGIGRGST